MTPLIETKGDARIAIGAQPFNAKTMAI